MASAVFACTSGPYCTRPVTPAGASPTETSPHPGHSFASTWYSVTSGGGGGAASNTCIFCIPQAGTSVRSRPQQPHAAGPHTTVLPGLADCLSVEDGAPGCLPGLRPDLRRSDRSFGFLVYGLSDEGGLDDVEESLARRRSSSSTRAASASARARSAASCAAAASSRAAAASRSRVFSVSSSATRARSQPTGSDGGVSGVPGTSRSSPEPAAGNQGDTPGQALKIKQPPPATRTPTAPPATQAE